MKIHVQEDTPHRMIEFRNVFSDPDDDPAMIVKILVSHSNPGLLNAIIERNTLVLRDLLHQFGSVEIPWHETPNWLTVDKILIVNMTSVEDALVIFNLLSEVTVAEGVVHRGIDLNEVFTDVKSRVANSNNSLLRGASHWGEGAGG